MNKRRKNKLVPLSVIQVADYFIAKSSPNTKYSVTHLKLQKLVYYAQGWYLALTNEPLFDEQLEAWVHGPVSPDLYGVYSQNGYLDIEKNGSELNIDVKAKEILDFIWENFGHYTGKQLENFTHEEKPWIIARGDLLPFQSSNNVITKESMREYFKSIIFEE